MATCISETRKTPSNLVSLLRRQAKQNPNKPVFSFLADGQREDSVVTYAELDGRARAIGSKLRETVSAGDRALLVYPPGIDFIAGFFGCLYAGAVGVPVNVPRRFRSMRQLDAIIDSCEPSVVLSNTALDNQKDGSYQKIPQLLELPWLATDDCQANGTQLADPFGADGDTLAFLQYTSGSTGMPKGVMVSHGNLINNLQLIKEAFGTGADDRSVSWLPLYHDMGLIGGVLQTVFCGGSTTLLSPATFLHRPLLWLQAISRLGASVSGGPDFAYDLCVRRTTPEARAKLDLSCWDVAFTGAEPIRSETLERFAEAFEPSGFRRESFFTCYGLAEATLMVTGGPRSTSPHVVRLSGDELHRNRVVEVPEDDENARLVVASGRRFDSQHVVIADPDSRTVCGDDRIGEIWVAGPCVAGGYYNGNGTNEATFGAYLSDTGEGPFLRTGDLGFCRDGELYVAGRRKDMIIIQGRNHCPQDIEQTIQLEHPDLRSGCGAAFSIEVQGYERLVVVNELERGRRDVDVDELLRSVRWAVATEHEIEVYAVVILKPTKLPRTSSGKVRRYLCREMFQKDQLNEVARWVESPAETSGLIAGSGTDRAAPAVPKSAEEIRGWLVDQVAGRLGAAPIEISISKPLFEFGMSSLDTVTIAANLEDWLGRELSPTAVYNYPTIEALAGWLSQQARPVSDIGNPKEKKGRINLGVSDDQLISEVMELSEEDMRAFLLQEAAKLDEYGN